ncbi:MAG: hypothetical protein AAGL98_04330, partial [Planctomycetota bacterium]
EEFNCAVLARLKSDTTIVLKDGLRRDWSKRRMTGGQRTSSVYRAARDHALAQDAVAVAWFDDTGEPVTVELWQQQAEGAATWFGMGVPLNDILAATDAPFQERPEGDIPRLPMGLVDARETGSTEPGFDDPPGLPDTPGDDDLEVIEPEDEVDPPSRTQRTLSEDQLLALWRNRRAQVVGIERQFVGPYRRHLMTLRSEVLANIRRVDPGRPEIDRNAGVKPVVLHYRDPAGSEKQVRVALSLQQRDLLGELLFDLRQATNSRWSVVGKFLRAGIAAGGESSMSEAAVAEGVEEPSVFAIESPGVEQTLRGRQFAIAGLTNDQRDRLRAVFARGLSEGMSTAQLAEAARTQFNLESNRAKLVAFQESSSAVEEGRQLGREQAGVPAKSWLWSRKETGRTAHAATERATLADPIPIDQDFVIAGTSITCPHPRATGIAEQDINCGCTTISRYPGDRVRDLAVLRHAARSTPQKAKP